MEVCEMAESCFFVFVFTEKAQVSLIQLQEFAFLKCSVKKIAHCLISMRLIIKEFFM